MKRRISLEESLKEIVRSRMGQTLEYQNLIEKEKVEKINSNDFEEFQLFQLRKTLDYVYEKSFFYRELFDKRGIRPGEIHSLADLSKLPLTEPADLAEKPLSFLCIPVGDAVRAITFTSSGTTGPQKRIFFSEKDIEVMIDFMAAGMRVVATCDDVVQIILPRGPVLGQADLLSRGITKMGAKPVNIGTEPTPEEQIQQIVKNNSTILFCETLRLNRISVETKDKYNLANLGVKILFLTSNYLSRSMRANVQTIWNCEIFAHYGLTEMGLGVAVECPAHNGYHFNEVDLLAEIIDPKTGEVLGDGEEGELVFTTLNREAMPLIRYRTHDLCKLDTKPCECGATVLKKLDWIKRRTESVIKIGEGDEIYPAIFDEALYAIPNIVDYEVSIKYDRGKHSLFFQVEINKKEERIAEEVREAILEIPAVKKNIKIGKMTIPTIELVNLGSLKKNTRAKKLIRLFN